MTSAVPASARLSLGPALGGVPDPPQDGLGRDDRHQRLDRRPAGLGQADQPRPLIGRDPDGPVDLRAEDLVLGFQVLNLAAQVGLERLGKDINRRRKRFGITPIVGGSGVGAGGRVQKRATLRLGTAEQRFWLAQPPNPVSTSRRRETSQPGRNRRARRQNAGVAHIVPAGPRGGHPATPMDGAGVFVPRWRP